MLRRLLFARLLNGCGPNSSPWLSLRVLRSALLYCSMPRKPLVLRIARLTVEALDSLFVATRSTRAGTFPCHSSSRRAIAMPRASRNQPGIPNRDAPSIVLRVSPSGRHAFQRAAARFTIGYKLLTLPTIPVTLEAPTLASRAILALAVVPIET